MSWEEYITEARRLRAAATQGEWHTTVWKDPRNGDRPMVASEGRTVVITHPAFDIKHFECEMNAELIAFAANNILAFADKVEELEREIATKTEVFAHAMNLAAQHRDELERQVSTLTQALDDANGQLGEFFNTPSGAIIKKLEQELSDEKAVVAILTAMNASSKSTQEWMNLEFQNTKLCEACEAAAGWMAKFSETGSKYDSDEVRTQLRAALEPK